MPPSHRVKVLEKDGNRLRLRLYIVQYDENSFCTAKNCALQMLWDQARPDTNRASPLGNVMSAENRIDAAWLVEHQDQFIEEVSLIETRNFPAAPDLDFNKHRTRLEGLPEAIIDIRVTDPKWIAHVRKGASWETALFDAEGYV